MLNIYFNFRFTLLFYSSFILFFLSINNSYAKNEMSIVVEENRNFTVKESETAIITTVKSSDIEKSGANNISELLDTSLGCTVNNYGGYGQISVANVRGISSEKVEIYYDDMKLNSFQGNSVNLNDIQLSDIDHIDIIRGSNLEGISIKIYTKKKYKKQFSLHSDITYGLFNTILSSLSIGGKFGDKGEIGYKLSLSGGISNGEYSYYDYNRSTDKNLQNVDYKSFSANTNLNYIPLNSYYEMQYNFYYNYLNSGVPGTIEFPTPDATMKSSQIMNNLSYKNIRLFGIENFNFQNLNYFITNKREYQETTIYHQDDKHISNSYGTNLIFNNNYKTFYLTYGLKYNYETLDSSAYDITNQPVKGLISNYETRFILTPSIKLFDYKYQNKNRNYIIIESGLLYQISKRYDDAYGYKLGTASELLKELRSTFKLSYSYYVRNPSFNDLFWSSSGFARGKSDLLPEKMHNTDFSINFQPITNIKADTTFFYNKIDDYIIWMPGAGGQWRPSNFDVLSYGIESQISFLSPQLLGLFFEASFNHTYNDIRSKDKNYSYSYDKYIPYKPIHKFNLALSVFDIESWSVRFVTRYIGYRFTTLTNSKWLDDYILYDLILGYNLDSNWKFSLTWKNILNTKYIDIENYPVPGWQLFLKVSYNI